MTLQRGRPRVVLASGSASRRALLIAAGLRFTIQPANVDEAGVRQQARAEGVDPGSAALGLAELKAFQVAEADPEALVIGADQILVCGGKWFDKPASMAAARVQLRELRGRSHVLETAVACIRGGACVWCHIARPVLTMRSFSEEFLDAYLAAEGNSVLGSVGAYRLEAFGAHLFEGIEGEHAAILGLPLLALLALLRREGVLVG